jgi:hypothetical protein
MKEIVRSMASSVDDGGKPGGAANDSPETRVKISEGKPRTVNDAAMRA